MVLNEKMVQREYDKSLEQKKYTEGLGKIFLHIAEVSVYKCGLHYRYTEFEIEFIIKPKIVDMLLMKCFIYNKKEGKAYSFMNLVVTSAIKDSVQSIREAAAGQSVDVYYFEDVKREMLQMENDILEYDVDSVILDNGFIKVKN